MVAVIAAVVVGGIYFGKPVLMPLALAMLMSFALSPLVGLLKRWGLGHVAPVLISLGLAIVILSALAGFMGSQRGKLGTAVPRCQTNHSHKVCWGARSVGQNGGPPPLNPTPDPVVGQVAGGRTGAAWISPSGPDRPVPVGARRPATTPWAMAQNVLGPLVEPLALIVMVLVFVGFILLQKDDLRDRIVRLAGSRDLQRTSIALDEAATRLSRYIFLQTLINTCFGLTIGAGLWLIGIPNAGLWGLMAMLLRFVPYVGVPLAFLFPATLALAVDPGWGRLVWVAVLYGGIEAMIGQAIEPFVYGRSMGLSAVAVVVAAVFWTWLWGPVGLLLSTPLTMCFVVLGRHIQALKFLEVMLGDQPALRSEESLYLRMLAEDPDEAADEAEVYLRDNSLMAYYDQVAGNALMLAQNDVNRGVLAPQRQEHIRDAVKGLIVNLSHHSDEDAAAALPVLPHGWTNMPVLCVAGRGPLDEAAGLLLVDILEKYGLGARLVSSEETSAAHIRELSGEGVRLVCVSYLEPGTFKNARYQVRRLRKHMPDVPVLALFWGLGADHSRYLDSVEATESDIVTTGLKETVTHILAFARRAGVIQSAL